MNKKLTTALVIAAATVVVGSGVFATQDLTANFKARFITWSKGNIATSIAETKNETLASAQTSKEAYELSVEEEKAAILSELEALSKTKAQSEAEIRKLLADYEAVLKSEKAKQLASIDNNFYVLRMQMIAQVEQMAAQFKSDTVDPAKAAIASETQEKINAIKAQIEQTTAELQEQLAADIVEARKQLLDSMQDSSEEVQQEVLAYFDRLMQERAAQVSAMEEESRQQISEETDAAVQSAKNSLAAVSNSISAQ